MTTPGRQAGPTADDGDLDPGPGGPGNGLPAGEAGYGLAPDPTDPGRSAQDGTAVGGPVPDGTPLDGRGLDGRGLDGTGLDGTGLDHNALDRAALRGPTLYGPALRGPAPHGPAPYGPGPEGTAPGSPGRDRAGPEHARPDSRRRGAGAPESRAAAAPESRPAGRSRARHAADKSDRPAPGPLNAQIAQTIENARAARNAAAGQSGRTPAEARRAGPDRADARRPARGEDTTRHDPAWPGTAGQDTTWDGRARHAGPDTARPGAARPEQAALDHTAVPAPAPSGATQDADTGTQGAASSSLLRSSGAMAVGTLASRVTGFLRSAILIYAIGTHDLANAYNLANTLPNIVYNLALGGILTSVVVPLLVNAAKRNRDHGEAYDQRIFTLGVLALGAITVVATAAAAPIASVYAGNIGNASAYHLTVIFAYFFIPQIFFYGVSSLAGAILNARGSFAAPMWTPVINNLVVILVGLAFMATAGLNRTPADISTGAVQLIGIGTTLGIVLQTVALIPSLRRVGFRWRPRRDFRRSEVAEIGHMSGWMFGYVLTTQIAFLVTTRVANAAGARVSQQAAGAGIAAYSNAYMLFQLPYAIVGISVITALLPRMSSHASEGKYRLVSADFSTAARLASVIVVPSALILAVLGTPLAEGVFGYGSTSVASARYVGEIFAVFSLGLLPFTLFQLLLRVFYAMHDSRTPALISVITMIINIAANLIALSVLPPQHVVAGLGAGFGIASLVGTVVAWRVLARRIGGLDGRAVATGLVRMHASAIPGVIFAVAVSVMVGAVLSGGRIAALLTVTVGGIGAMFLYVMFAKAFGVDELDDLTASLRSRLR
jgi:putative peptidoglycan lipid II flippase